MGDNALRHIVAIIATLICFFAYLAGYISGGHGWWWTAFAVIIIYGGVYRIIDK